MFYRSTPCLLVRNFEILTRADLTDDRFVIVADDGMITGEILVEFSVTRVNQQGLTAQLDDLLLCGEDDDIFLSDAAQDLGGKLLVAASEQKALTAGDGNDQLGGLVADHFKDLLEPVVKKYGMEMGVIAQAPMEGLIEYHLEA